MAIFVAPRVMSEQIFRGLDPKPAKREQLWARDPLQLFKALQDFH
jgi:hypothetical protein